MSELEHMALEVIEEICCECDTCEPYQNTPLMEMIYRFAHIAHHECLNPHDDWVQELKEARAKLKKEGHIL